MINPLNIAADSGAHLVWIYVWALAWVLLAAALVLRFGRGAPQRRRWARANKAAFAGVLLVFWICTLYGGSKGTNRPPVIPPGEVNAEFRLYWDKTSDRDVPALLPLRRVDP